MVQVLQNQRISINSAKEQKPDLQISGRLVLKSHEGNRENKVDGTFRVVEEALDCILHQKITD